MPEPILVVGSANLDLVFRTKRFPRPGETLLGGEFCSSPGGKGANQAVAIAKLGGDVSFVGCVGRDPFGSALEASMQEAGVDTSNLSRHKSLPSGCASIVVSEDGSNEIIVAPGANGALSGEQVRKALGHDLDRWVLAQLEVPIEAVLAASEVSHFILNPAPACELPAELLSRCFAIVPNETETEILTGIDPKNPRLRRDAAAALVLKGAGNVVITLGNEGCYWTDGTRELHLPPFPVKAVDTVAAGDAFCGALALWLSRGNDWEHALAFANRAGALATTKEGAQAAMPSLAEMTGS